MRLIDSNSLAA